MPGQPVAGGPIGPGGWALGPIVWRPTGFGIGSAPGSGRRRPAQMPQPRLLQRLMRSVGWLLLVPLLLVPLIPWTCGARDRPCPGGNHRPGPPAAAPPPDDRCLRRTCPGVDHPRGSAGSGNPFRRRSPDPQGPRGRGHYQTAAAGGQPSRGTRPAGGAGGSALFDGRAGAAQRPLHPPAGGG